MSNPLAPDNRVSYVLDTSALISNPKILDTLTSCTIIIPMEVLEELDKLKIRDDQVGQTARHFNRYFDSIRENGNLLVGIQTENDSIIQVVSNPGALLSIFDNTVDNKIISTAFHISREVKNLVVLSNDIAFRVKCDAIGLKAESAGDGDYKITDTGYTGITELEVTSDIIQALYDDKSIVFEDVEFYPNQGVLLKTENSKALCIATKKDTLEPLFFTKGKKFNVEGIFPRNMEQTIAFELLLDPDIPLVTLNGMAGCGKTLLSIASAMSMNFQGVYDKIIISRPVESTSKDIGYLPGTKEEKMAPWIQPIFDNLRVLYKKKGEAWIKAKINKKEIEVEAISHIRGRSLPNTFFIIDEAQNINRHEAKALLTRMGENSKIVLIGDLEQIDSPKLTNKSSGLGVIIEAFKDSELAGHVKLTKGERSALATYAAKVL